MQEDISRFIQALLSNERASASLIADKITVRQGPLMYPGVL
jgi:hypothetical protein